MCGRPLRGPSPLLVYPSRLVSYPAHGFTKTQRIELPAMGPPADITRSLRREAARYGLAEAKRAGGRGLVFAAASARRAIELQWAWEVSERAGGAFAWCGEDFPTPASVVPLPQVNQHPWVRRARRETVEVRAAMVRGFRHAARMRGQHRHHREHRRHVRRRSVRTGPRRARAPGRSEPPESSDIEARRPAAGGAL